MAELKLLHVILLAKLLGYFVVTNGNENLVSRDCLGCMCEAVSGCDVNFPCVEGSSGLFCITKNYWIDAYKPVLWRDYPDNVNAYQNCVIDPFCAAEAVERYVRRYHKDCNKDGKEDCRDYMQMHLQGLTCIGTLNPYVMQRFNVCWTGVLRDLPEEQSSKAVTQTMISTEP